MKRLAAIITAVLFTAMTGCGVETEQSTSVAVTEYSKSVGGYLEERISPVVYWNNTDTAS